MGKNTSISWCHHTFSPWWGCFKISDGCKNCYAATFDRRVHGTKSDHWDVDGSRRFMSDDYWLEPFKWNEKAKADGVRYRVFCGSMCDWAEQHQNAETNAQLNILRTKLFALIALTPYLDWLLLSKRIDVVERYLPWFTTGAKPWPNVWIGTTVENQEMADQRVPVITKIDAAVRFLSCEPLLGPVDLTRICNDSVYAFDSLRAITNYPVPTPVGKRIHWVIAGAESGHRARECDVNWLRFLRDQCAEVGTKFFLKQATWRPPITLGAGARTKGKGFGGPMVELPYLDNRQHADVPEVA